MERTRGDRNSTANEIRSRCLQASKRGAWRRQDKKGGQGHISICAIVTEGGDRDKETCEKQTPHYLQNNAIVCFTQSRFLSTMKVKAWNDLTYTRAGWLVS